MDSYYLGMDRKGCCIDRFVSYDYLAVFVYENQVRYADCGEVLREWIQPYSYSLYE